MANEKQKNINYNSFSKMMLIAGFLAMLLFPAIQESFKLIPEIPSTENRKPTEKPIIKWDYLDPFPLAYENYYTDHFSFRNHLIRIKSLFIIKVFNQSPMPDRVLVGKENWLYHVKDELEHYKATYLLSQAQLDSITDEMIRRKEYLNQKGIHLYFAIAPTKYTIYPEHLPSSIHKMNNLTRTDQVINVLKDAGINVIDLRKPLLEAKGKNLLYFKTDNHWNPYGGFVASAYIIDLIKKDFPNLPSLSLNDYNITQISVKGGNTAHMLSMENQFEDISYKFEQINPIRAKEAKKTGYPLPPYFPDPSEYEIVYESGNDSLPSIIVIRDSFGQAVIPFLSQSFNRSLYIFDGWIYTLNEPIILNENPDIMIYLVFESLWDGILIGVKRSLK
jgi:alginate O-acetyltransferase complex protein AlgJ